jgi:hypothetical protein
VSRVLLTQEPVGQQITLQPISPSSELTVIAGAAGDGVALVFEVTAAIADVAANSTTQITVATPGVLGFQCVLACITTGVASATKTQLVVTAQADDLGNSCTIQITNPTNANIVIPGPTAGFKIVAFTF